MHDIKKWAHYLDVNVGIKQEKENALDKKLQNNFCC